MGGAQPRAVTLSPRQLQSVRYAARFGRADAAARIGIAVGTLDMHLSAAYLRLGARSLAEAVYTLAARGQLGDFDPPPAPLPGLLGADPGTWSDR